MGIYLFVTNLCSDTVRPDREEGETRGCRSEIAAKTVTSVKWRLSEMKKRLLASVLSLAMVATMMPAALADDVTDGSVDGSRAADSIKYVAKVCEQEYQSVNAQLKLRGKVRPYRCCMY